jgi:hypothetical protein
VSVSEANITTVPYVHKRYYLGNVRTLPDLGGFVAVKGIQSTFGPATFGPATFGPATSGPALSGWPFRPVGCDLD